MPLRLIETWDVLKFPYTPPQIYRIKRLIETWDVLKFCLDSKELNSICD